MQETHAEFTRRAESCARCMLELAIDVDRLVRRKGLLYNRRRQAVAAYAALEKLRDCLEDS